MATVDEVKRDLNKLNKSDLIRIIIEKKVSGDIKISDKVVNYIEVGENSEFSDAVNDVADNLGPEHAKPVSLSTLKCDLKISQIELQASKRLISELERTISNQELIIHLMQKSINLEVNNVPNVNNPNVLNTVADVPQNSVGQKLPSKGNVTIKKITPKQVSSAILQAQSSLKTQKVQNIENNKNAVRPNVKIVGENGEGEDVVSKEKIWVYATKYRQSYTTDKMQKYLEAKFPDYEFSCTLYENKVTGTNSFRIAADAELRDDLFKPESWPRGVEISEYFFRRRRNFSQPSKFGRYPHRKQHNR